MKNLRFQGRVAFAMVSVFVGNVILSPLAEANFWQERNLEVATISAPSVLAPTPPLLKMDKPQFPIPNWMESAIIPYASIQDVYKSPRDKNQTIILIQDAHLHFEAQKNIAALIESLGQHVESQNGKVLLGLEGTDRDNIDFGITNQYAHRELLKESAMTLLKKKILKGAEVAVIGYPSQNSPFTVSGMEDFDEYNGNVDALRNGMTQKSNELEKLSIYEAELHRKKKRVLSRELKEFEARWTQHHSNDLDLPAYAVYLDSIENVTYPELNKVVEAALIEDALDFELVEEERASLLQFLLHQLNRSEVKHLVSLSSMLKAGLVDQSDYYTSLKSLMNTHGFELSQYPEMSLYIQYVLKTEAIQVRQLTEELDSHENKIKQKLIKTKEQEELFDQLEWISLRRKLVQHELTEAEWKKYKTLNSEEDVFEQFYELAFQRSRTMAKNMQLKMVDGQFNLGILVTGGFHTDEIYNQLINSGFNILTVSPEIKTLEEGPSSLEFLNRDRRPLDEIFVGDRLFLDMVPETSRPAPNVVLNLVVGIPEIFRKGLTQLHQGPVRLVKGVAKGLRLPFKGQNYSAHVTQKQQIESFFGESQPLTILIREIAFGQKLHEFRKELRDLEGRTSDIDLEYEIKDFLAEWNRLSQKKRLTMNKLNNLMRNLIVSSPEVIDIIFKLTGYEEVHSDSKDNLTKTLNKVEQYFKPSPKHKVFFHLLNRAEDEAKLAFSYKYSDGQVHIWATTRGVARIEEGAKPLFSARDVTEWSHAMFFMHELLHQYLEFSHALLIKLKIGPGTEAVYPDILAQRGYDEAKKKGILYLAWFKDPSKWMGLFSISPIVAFEMSPIMKWGLFGVFAFISLIVIVSHFAYRNQILFSYREVVRLNRVKNNFISEFGVGPEYVHFSLEVDHRILPVSKGYLRNKDIVKIFTLEDIDRLYYMASQAMEREKEKWDSYTMVDIVDASILQPVLFAVFEYLYEIPIEKIRELGLEPQYDYFPEENKLLMREDILEIGRNIINADIPNKPEKFLKNIKRNPRGNKPSGFTVVELLSLLSIPVVFALGGIVAGVVVVLVLVAVAAFILMKRKANGNSIPEQIANALRSKGQTTLIVGEGFKESYKYVLEFLTSGKENVVALKGLPGVMDELPMLGNPTLHVTTQKKDVIRYLISAMQKGVDDLEKYKKKYGDTPENVGVYDARSLGLNFEARTNFKRAYKRSLEAISDQAHVVHDFEEQARSTARKFSLVIEERDKRKQLELYPNVPVFDLRVKTLNGRVVEVPVYDNIVILQKGVKIIGLGKRTVERWGKIINDSDNVIVLGENIKKIEGVLKNKNVISVPPGKYAQLSQGVRLFKRKKAVADSPKRAPPAKKPQDAIQIIHDAFEYVFSQIGEKYKVLELHISENRQTIQIINPKNKEKPFLEYNADKIKDMVAHAKFLAQKYGVNESLALKPYATFVLLNKLVTSQGREVQQWKEIADDMGMDEATAEKVQKALRGEPGGKIELPRGMNFNYQVKIAQAILEKIEKARSKRKRPPDAGMALTSVLGALSLSTLIAIRFVDNIDPTPFIFIIVALLLSIGVSFVVSTLQKRVQPKSYSPFEDPLDSYPRLKKIVKQKLDELSKPWATYRDVREEYGYQITSALDGRYSKLRMIRSYAEYPDGTEEGLYAAIDWGGTNLTIRLYRLTPDQDEKYTIVGKPVDHEFTDIHRANPHEAFLFVARSLKKLMKKNDLEIDGIGMTFAFPIRANSESSAIIGEVSKGWDNEKYKGLDLVKELNAVLIDEGLSEFKISSPENDTMDPLLLQAYLDRTEDAEAPHVLAGGIVGTGVNFVVNLNGIFYNTETGFFLGVEPLMTEADWKLARMQEKQGSDKKYYEQMVSGKFLGELLRLELESIRKKTRGRHFAWQKEYFSEPFSIDTKALFSFFAGSASDSGIGLLDYFDKKGIQTTEVEKKIVTELSMKIAQRSAMLVGMVLAQFIERTDISLRHEHTFSYVGSVITKNRLYQTWVNNAVNLQLGHRIDPNNIRHQFLKDAGAGAAVNAAVRKRKNLKSKGFALSSFAIRLVILPAIIIAFINPWVGIPIIITGFFLPFLFSRGSPHKVKPFSSKLIPPVGKYLTKFIDNRYTKRFIHYEHVDRDIYFDENGEMLPQAVKDLISRSAPVGFSQIETINQMNEDESNLVAFKDVYDEARLKPVPPLTIWDQQGGFKAMIDEFNANTLEEGHRLIIMQTESDFKKNINQYMNMLGRYKLKDDYRDARQFYRGLDDYYASDRVWYLDENVDYEPEFDTKTGLYDISKALTYFKRKAMHRNIVFNDEFVVISDWRQFTWNKSDDFLKSVVINTILNVNLIVTTISGKLKIFALAAKQA